MDTPLIYERCPLIYGDNILIMVKTAMEQCLKTNEEYWEFYGGMTKTHPSIYGEINLVMTKNTINLWRNDF